MRKILSFLLVFSLLCGGILLPQNAWADNHKQKKQSNQGQSKKMVVNNCVRDFGKIKPDFNKGFKLTRAQLAAIIAQKDANFKKFKESKEISKKINDYKAIPEKYRKAVCFVVSEEIMEDLYKILPNGKIVFQPNKQVTFMEFLCVLRNYECSQNADADKDKDEDKDEGKDVREDEVIYTGTVRLVEKIGNNTWITVKNSEGLFSAYFTANNVPNGLKTGMEIEIKVNVNNNKIVESNLIQETKNLLTANQSNVEQDLTGFSNTGFNTYAGAKLNKTTSEKWQGKSSLQVTTIGYNAWQGVNTVYQGEGLTGPLTFSFYVKAPVGTPLRAVVYDQDNKTYPTGGVLNFKATGEWERQAVTFTPIKSSENLSLQITLDNFTNPTVFYLDGLQLEKGSQVSTWVSGD